MSTGPLNSARPTTAEIVGGVYNATTPAPADKQAMALQVDNEGNLLVNVAIGGGGGSGTVKITDTSGNALNSNGTGALNVAVVSGGGSNPSVGTTGAPAPTSATEIGWVDGSGNLQDVAAATPLPDNLVAWGGTAVTAALAASTPPTGAEAAPAIRPISRKFGAILSTANLAGAGVFTGNWTDTNATGDAFVEATIFANQVGAVNGFMIQVSDDTTNTNTQRIVAQASVAASTVTTIIAIVNARYWRVVYTNGATLTTTLEITATGMTNVPYAILSSMSTNGFVTLLGTALVNQNTTLGMLTNPSIPVAAAAIGIGTDGSLTTANANLSNGASGNLAVTPYMATSAGNPATLSAQRTPNIFKTASATAVGNTALWTPTAGKKFRLMRFFLQVTDNAFITSGVVCTISFQDQTTAIGLAFDVFLPSSAFNAGLAGFSTGWIDLGNGFLSAAANNVLNINLTTALNGGNVRVTACGTEE